jgi:hypothetical protein
MKPFLLGATTMLILMAATCYAIGPQLFTVHLIAHDAAGRTLQATAKGNWLAFSDDAAMPILTLDFSSDSVLCNSFGDRP